MNKSILTGRLTADPELTETTSGVSLCRFSIAVQRDYKTDGEYKTDFFEVTAWRELAETVARYSKKGDKVLVEGSIQPRQYEDNKGAKHKTVDIIAQKVEFLTPKAIVAIRETVGQPAPLTLDDLPEVQSCDQQYREKKAFISVVSGEELVARVNRIIEERTTVPQSFFGED